MNALQVTVTPRAARAGRLRLGVLFLVLGWALGGGAPPLRMEAADPQVLLEYRVKAGYLFNFAKFIEWPAKALPAVDSPFIIAVLDGEAAASVVGQVLAGKSIGGRAVQVRSATAGAVPLDAHVLFVTRESSRTVQEIRESLGKSSTLLVGETDEFAELGGAIGFVLENESIRLTLCLEHASENGLKVSAKLANVAKSVKSKRKH